MRDNTYKPFKPVWSLTAWQITLIYIIIGIFWIPFSDRLLLGIISDPVLLTKVQSLKGWFFVIATSALIFVLIHYLEKALRTSEAQYRDLFNNLPLGLYRTSSSGQVLASNPTLAQIMGHSNIESMPERLVHERYVNKNDRIRWENILLKNGTVQNFEVQYRRLDGQIIWVEENSRVVKDNKGKILFYEGSMQDITKRKLVELSLRQSEHKFRTLIENMNEGLLQVDNDDIVQFVNPRLCQIFGYTEDELIGKVAKDIIINEQERKIIDKKNALRREGVADHYQIHARTKQGELLWVDISGAPLEDEDGQIIGSVGIITDVTRRKKAEEAVLEEQYRAQKYLDVAGVLMLALNEKGEINLLNQRGYEVLGYEPGSLTGKNWFDTCLPESVREDIRAVFTKLITYNYIPKGFGEYHENLVITQNGEQRIIGWRNTILTDRNGRVIGSLSSGEDMTERKKAEADLHAYRNHLEDLVNQRTVALQAEIAERKRAEERLQAYTIELERSNRELQDFAYLASHDLQEPLRKIHVFGERVQQKYAAELDDTGQDYLARMQNAAERMQTLIGGLLNYSRITTKANPFQPVDLNLIVQQVILDLELSIEAVNGEIIIKDLPTLNADALQMRQLFQNLISNSLKYHREGDTPVITLQAEITTSTEAETEQSVALITVSDNGIGFEPQYAERIFGMFQRLHTRAEYPGSGVGLALCRKIVERHGGTIIAQGEPGRGSKFIITLAL